MSRERPHLLPADVLVLQPSFVARVRDDYHRLLTEPWPGSIEAYVRDAHGLDVSASYAGLPLKNPWGVASGQLSMRAAQVEAAAQSGVGFVVLKTVIAEDETGDRSMAAWAIKESRMVVEPIHGRETGAVGWTVTWKGRGWWDTFDAYLELVRDATTIGLRHDVVIAPSVKYHLPDPDESAWRTGEYASTTRRILDAFQAGGGREPMPIEKDFSPTLAGSDRARRHATIRAWLTEVPGLIRQAAAPRGVRVGLKLMNAVDDDAFQIEMLKQVHESNRPDYLVYANRLFDPEREFDGVRGVAYGGPDLSDRNLRLLSDLRDDMSERSRKLEPLEISGTGDVCSGKMAVEYALRGCSSVQLHTLFQLPSEAFEMKRGDKIQRALHRLYFHPSEGMIVWARYAAERLGLENEGLVRWLDLAAAGTRDVLTRTSLDPLAR